LAIVVGAIADSHVAASFGVTQNMGNWTSLIVWTNMTLSVWLSGELHYF
jgi:hypothetical protein